MRDVGERKARGIATNADGWPMVARAIIIELYKQTSNFCKGRASTAN